MISLMQDIRKDPIADRIMELQSALFFTESASLVKLPTHVIPEVTIGEEGDIWFTIARPTQHLSVFEQEFPAKLDFFKKGKDFFVKVKGIAQLIEDGKQTDTITIRFMIQSAELINNAPKPNTGWLQSGRTQLSSWFS